MRTRENTENIYNSGPKPRRSIHSYKMDRNVRTSPRNYPNLINASTEKFETDTISDHSSSDFDAETHTQIDVKVEEQSAYHQTAVGTVSVSRKQWSLRFKQKSKDTERKYDSTGGAKFCGLNSKYSILLITIIALLCACFYTYFVSEDTLPPLNYTVTETRHEKNLRMKIKHIRDEFPSQYKSIWTSFTAGIKNVQENPIKPSVFLLVHETEEETPVCLAQKIGITANQFLNASKERPLLLEGGDLMHNETLLENYGILIVENHHKMEEHRTMIVNNLHKIPAVVAQSFHSFCDTVTPLVDKAVYFFTMRVSGANNVERSPTKLAEEELKRLWSDYLSEDVLTPLVVRITDRVMVVMPEINLSPTC